MKITAFTLMFFLSSAPLVAQQLPEWYRIHTFDDSVVEMNTAQVTFGGDSISRFGPNVGRVRFRWTFDQPQSPSGESQLKYKSRLETFAFNCPAKSFWPYDVTLLDATGKVVRVEKAKQPGVWRRFTSGSMMEKFFTPACQLIEVKLNPPVVSNEKLALKRVEKIAFSFSRRLEQTRDFAPLIKEFFSPDYLNGYVRDESNNWFLNLDRETAKEAGHADLQKFYIAALNVGYLSSLYFISQSPDASAPVPDEKLMPPATIRLIQDHPYTAAYKGAASNYDYLAESINSLERLQSYTDLLGKSPTHSGGISKQSGRSGPSNTKRY